MPPRTKKRLPVGTTIQGQTGVLPLLRRTLVCACFDAYAEDSEVEVPVDLLIHNLTAAFFAVLIWWMDRRSHSTPPEIGEAFHALCKSEAAHHLVRTSD